MRQLQTREQKIKFLQDMQQGKTSLQNLIKPITGILLVCNGKVFAHTNITGGGLIEPEIDLTEYEQQFENFKFK